MFWWIWTHTNRLSGPIKRAVGHGGGGVIIWGCCGWFDVIVTMDSVIYKTEEDLVTQDSSEVFVWREYRQSDSVSLVSDYIYWSFWLPVRGGAGVCSRRRASCHQGHLFGHLSCIRWSKLFLFSSNLLIKFSKTVKFKLCSGGVSLRV